jgi:hypothetical protein
MKKALVILLVLAVSIGVYASGTRVASIGEIRFGDSSEIGTYPGLRTKWSNYACGTFAAGEVDNDFTGGFVIDAGPGVLGVALNNGFDWLDLTMTADELKTWSLTYGLNLGGMNLGLNFTNGRDFEKNENVGGVDETLIKTSYMGFGLGVSNDVFDLGLKMAMPNWKAETSVDGVDDTTFGGTGFEAHMRYLPLEFGNFGVVPELGFVMGSVANQDDDIKTSVMNINFNTVLAYNLNEDTKVLMDVELFGLESETITYADTLINAALEIDKETKASPFKSVKFGVESKIKPWLCARFGGVKEYMKTKETMTPWEGDDAITTTFDQDFKLTFGLGLTFGKVVLDVNLEEGLLLDGPNFITGAVNPWASEITVKYNF